MASNEARCLNLVRPEILRLEPYHCAREKVLEGVLLDANENPFPRSRGKVLLNRYPDPHQTELRRAYAAKLGVGPENVLAGAGSDEVLDWIFKVFQCSRGVAVAEPTYGMYRVLADIYGCPIFEYRLGEGFEFSSEGFLRAVPDQVRILFLCSPNNPTGNLLSSLEIRKLVERWDGLVVLDEAYIDFAEAESLAPDVKRFPNLIVLRTFSKAYGRAGLRLGFGIACPEIIDSFLKVKSPYNLSSLTLREGLQAIGQEASLKRQIRAILKERERVADRLERMDGVETVFRSDANFILFRCAEAREICRRLLEQGVVVRDRSSLPGLADCIRVTIGTREENSLFLRQLEGLLNPVA